MVERHTSLKGCHGKMWKSYSDLFTQGKRANEGRKRIWLEIRKKMSQQKLHCKVVDSSFLEV